jgi:hypothetical protein
VKQSYVAALESNKNYSAKKATQIALILQVEWKSLMITDYPEDNNLVIPKPRLEAVPLHLAGDPNDFDNDGSRFEELPDGTLGMRIHVIPNKAFAAGYLQSLTDSQFYEDLEHTSIQVFKKHQGHYVAFEVKGQSMTTLEPELFRKSIFDGVKIAGRELPRKQWRYKLHAHPWDAWVIVHRKKAL